MKVTRELGDKLPLSISTAIPFEKVITDDSLKPKRLLLSLRTLFRNFINAYPKVKMEVKQQVEEFDEEIDRVSSYCKMQRVQLVLYDCDYGKINRVFPNVIKPDSWRKKVEFEGMYFVVKKQISNNFSSFDIDYPLPQRSSDNEFIMTSFPVDLLILKVGINTSLLESHTGFVKTPNNWITKLTSNKKYHSWPFNSFTYQLLGDKSLTNKGASLKLKKEVLNISLEKRWKQHYTITRCKLDISSSSLPNELKKEILKYF